MKPLQSGNTYTMPALQGNRFHKNINMFIEKTEVYDVRKDKNYNLREIIGHY
jgi:hypothetical protein